jgi:hypothetical protein
MRHLLDVIHVTIELDRLRTVPLFFQQKLTKLITCNIHQIFQNQLDISGLVSTLLETHTEGKSCVR